MTSNRRAAEEPVTAQVQSSPSWSQDLRDAVAPRTVVLILGVLFLALAFVLSYVGALHSPKPHRIKVAVVAAGSAAPSVVRQLNGISGDPVHAYSSPSVDTARSDVLARKAYAAYVVNSGGTSDTLYVASAAGASVAQAAQQVFTQVAATQRRTVTVADLRPAQDGDYRGITGFYLVVAALVGGYLAASAIGMARGTRPTTARRGAIRLAAMVPFSLAGGLGSALIIDPWLGAITGHFWSLVWVAALVTFVGASVAMAMQVAFGTAGIGAVVLVFVVLGNPSSGGPYQASMLPPFWRAIGGALPNGAGVELLRNDVYFSGHHTGRPLATLAVWALGGMIVLLLLTALAQRRRDSDETFADGLLLPATGQA